MPHTNDILAPVSTGLGLITGIAVTGAVLGSLRQLQRAGQPPRRRRDRRVMRRRNDLLRDFI